MTLVAHYAFHKSIFSKAGSGMNRALTAPRGTFEHMALQPATDDRYLTELLSELHKYDKGVIDKTFNIELKSPVQEPAPNIGRIFITELLRATLQMTSGIVERTVSVQDIIKSTELRAHHSSLLIEIMGSHIDNPDTSESMLNKLRALKRSLLKLNYQLELVLMFYTFLPKATRPSIHAIREAIKKVKKTLKLMKPKTTEELYKFFPVDRQYTITFDDVLCSIVGLSGTLRQQLESIQPEERSHQTDEYLIKQMLQDLYDNVIEDDTISDKERTFLELTFTPSKAKIFGEMLATNTLKRQQTILYWAQRFIENVFQYDILLQDIVVRLDAKYADGWQVSTEGRVPTDVEVSPQITIPSTFAKSGKEVLEFASHLSDGESVVLFHGTDGMSARHIVENGIMLGHGNPMQDFSDGSGFYLTTNPQVAYDWARFGNFAPYAAVVAFKVEKRVLEEYTKLSLPVEETEWKDVVSYNRSGRDRRIFKPPSSTKKNYHDARYVEGRVCESAGMLDRAQQPIHDRHTPGRYQQICILSDEMAERVGDIRNVSVCFFNKSHA